MSLLFMDMKSFIQETWYENAFVPSPFPPSFYPLHLHILFVGSIETGMQNKVDCLVKYFSGTEDPIHRV